MEAYCIICKKYSANGNSSVKKTKQNRSMLFYQIVLFVVRQKQFFKKNKELLNFDNISND